MNENEDKKSPACARCPFKPADKLCRNEKGKALPFCPTRDSREVLQECLEKYGDTENFEFSRQAAIQSDQGKIRCGENDTGEKPTNTRMEEILEFIEKMKYRRIGLAFCITLKEEARVVENLLSSRGLDVISVICRVGRESKEHVGVDPDPADPRTGEAMCNPIAQAQLLNRERTEFNVVLGLCVGHDSLFFKYSDAMCTVLAAKDRVLGHNPLAAIYTVQSSYKYLKDSD